MITLVVWSLVASVHDVGATSPGRPSIPPAHPERYLTHPTPARQDGPLSLGTRSLPKLPEPLGYVSDHAKVLDAEWKARIRSVCEDLERKTGVELVVVTVPKPAPYKTAQEYASALYERWGIGTAQQEHGLMVLAVIEDRTAAMTVGRPLYGQLPKERVEQIGHETIEPEFRHGHYGEGLYKAAVLFATHLQDFRIGVKPRSHLKGFGVWLTLAMVAGLLWFLWSVSRPDLRHPFGKIRRGEFWGSGRGGFGGGLGGDSWR